MLYFIELLLGILIPFKSEATDGQKGGRVEKGHHVYFYQDFDGLNDILWMVLDREFIVWTLLEVRETVKLPSYSYPKVKMDRIALGIKKGKLHSIISQNLCMFVLVDEFACLRPSI